MLCYLNRGLILEQAIVALIRDYFESLHLDNKYRNFHISVTTEHPFAELYLHDGSNASDSFPCIVVTTQEDGKPNEFSELGINETAAVGITESDLESIIRTTETYTDKKGVSKTRDIPGLCTIVDENTLNAIRETIAKQEYCYGYSIRTRRKDTAGIEIWAENVQLKNEIYEQLRLFVSGNLRFLLANRYPFFDIAIFDETIIGRRSNNYNFDFDVVLSGAHISLEINYCVEQLVLNTELSGMSREIITEVLNSVK
jgi:hypothetical protein